MACSLEKDFGKARRQKWRQCHSVLNPTSKIQVFGFLSCKSVPSNQQQSPWIRHKFHNQLEIDNEPILSTH